ncbi:MAG: cysteine desulfurase [Chitinophagales bacterium]|nr:cysteine desulfurase [Chitinophagales bacterium]
MKNIYLDYNATTPVDEQVLNKMLPFFTRQFGNAASHTHAYGAIARDAVEEARSHVAQLLNADTQEIIFTSGSTESLNLAIQGVFSNYRIKGNHILYAATEHKAVIDTCMQLTNKGAVVEAIPVSKDGTIDAEKLSSLIRDETIAVCIMLANNETGVIQDINSLASIIHERQAIAICDTTQAIGKIPVDVQALQVDIACVSAHKLYGPKGVGALYVRRKNPRVSLSPFIFGGGHERGLRSGTLNVPGIVGLGEACHMAMQNISQLNDELLKNRDFLENELRDFIEIIYGDTARRLPNTSMMAFKHIKAEQFIRETMGWLSVSTGSACTSADQQPSHVLTAMGVSRAAAAKAIRFSLGKFTTMEELDFLVRKLKQKFQPSS